mgnify:CR=1 FL=1
MTIESVLSGERRWHIECCRAEELELLLPDGCVDLILTDPPFHKVKDLAWDREHKTAGGFLDWIGERLAAWQRLRYGPGVVRGRPRAVPALRGDRAGHPAGAPLVASRGAAAERPRVRQLDLFAA